jgi:iron complex outermembrane receptor protein
VEATVGLRADYERKGAEISEYLATPLSLPPAAAPSQRRSFSDVSPQFTLAYHAVPDRHMLYATAARGFKAGGFNAAAPPGSTSYDNEHSWNYEGGVKTLWFSRRLSLNAAAFFIDWTDLQINVPNPFSPLQFYLANAGEATSRGFEFEMITRVLEGCEFFGGFGYTSARFGDDVFSGGVNVSGHELPNTPGYTGDLGGQYTVAVTPAASVYARAQVIFKGEYFYDDANRAAQEAYSLTDFRFGTRGRRLFAEAWLRNAFDTKYAPIAFAAPGLAPSGFLAEAGAPRTFGVRAGVTF